MELDVNMFDIDAVAIQLTGYGELLASHWAPVRPIGIEECGVGASRAGTSQHQLLEEIGGHTIQAPGEVSTF